MDILASMTNKLLEQHTSLKNAIKKQVKAEVPKTKFSPVIRNWAIDNLGTKDMDALRQEYGDEAIERLLFERYKPDKRRL